MRELEQKPKSRLTVALGYFDGVHLGHRQVLGAAVRAARAQGLQSGVFTFVFGEENPIKGDAILAPEERRRRIGALGLDWYYCPSYDDFCGLSPEQFVDDILLARMNAAAVFCGDNFTFGCGGAGNVALLQSLCAARGIAVTVVPMAQDAGGPDVYKRQDLEGITSIPRMIEGVVVGVTMRQLESGSYKVSVRTAGEIDACKICAALGGGGHMRAAGCEFFGNLENAKAAVLAEVEKQI